MDLKIGDATLTFTGDGDAGRRVAVVELPAWRGFASDNSRTELQGARVQLVLAPADPAVPAELADRAHYERAVPWLFAHQEAARQAVLDAVAGYIDVLRNDYGVEDDELDAFRSADQLRAMIDPSFVHVYPQHRDGLPFLGVELECNWDPEHGCGALLHGTVVLDVGGAETARAADLVDEHGSQP